MILSNLKHTQRCIHIQTVIWRWRLVFIEGITFLFFMNWTMVLVPFHHIPLTSWKPVSPLVRLYWSQLRKTHPQTKWNQQHWSDLILITERTVRCFSPSHAKSSYSYYNAQWERPPQWVLKEHLFPTWCILLWELWVKGGVWGIMKEGRHWFT